MPKGQHNKGKSFGNPFSSNNQPPKNGRNPKPKFADLLDEIAKQDGKMQFDKFKIIHVDEKEMVEIQLPSEMAMAIKLWNMANKDVRWFTELAKIRNLYAPSRIENRKVNIHGDDIEDPITKLIESGGKIVING